LTGITATNNLVYPTSGDRLVDQGKYTRDLAVALDNRLRSHDLDIARSDVPPYAVVERTTPKDFIPSTDAFDFETVLVDTNSMVSLEQDASVITMNKLGWWTVGVYVQINGTSCNPGYASLAISVDTGDFVVDAHDGQVGFVAGSSETLFRVTYSTSGFPKANSTVFLSGTNCAAVVTTQRVRMWAYWMRDL